MRLVPTFIRCKSGHQIWNVNLLSLKRKKVTMASIQSLGVLFICFCQGTTFSELSSHSLSPVCSTAVCILHGDRCTPVTTGLSSPLFGCRFTWDICPVLGNGGGCLSRPVSSRTPVLTAAYGRRQSRSNCCLLRSPLEQKQCRTVQMQTTMVKQGPWL